MPELTLISPLLNGMVDAEFLSGHGNTAVYRVRHESSGLYFIVKHISIPESAAHTTVLVENGTIPTYDEAPAYYESVVNQYRQELVCLHKLAQSPNICSCLRFQVVRKQDRPGFDLYTLCPYRIPLLDYLDDNRISSRTAIQIGMDLCNALIVLRQNGFIHQNLKPENIFLENGHFAISGFGLTELANLQSPTNPYPGCFAAPEVFDTENTLNQTIDLYSIGLLLYYMYHGNELPFTGDPTTEETPLNRRISGEELPPLPSVAPELDALIRKACAPHAEDRFQTPEELLDALQTYLSQHEDDLDTIITPLPAPSVDTPEQTLPAPETEDASSTADTPAAVSPKKPKRSKKKLIIPLLITLPLLLIVAAVAFLYFSYTAITVSEIAVLDKGIDYITVGLETENTSNLLVTCSEQDGTDLATYRAEDRVTFYGLESGTTYNITVDSMDWHYVNGVIGGTATTMALTDILEFHASAQENGKIHIEFESDGFEPEAWSVRCSNGFDEDLVYELDGHSGTLEGLLANCEYTLTLDAGNSSQLRGSFSIPFSYSLPVAGSDLVISEMSEESMTVSWTADSEAASGWTAVCSDNNGYSSTVETGTCSATFTGLSPNTEYEITVSNTSMSVPMYLKIKTVRAEVTSFNVSANGTNATLSWEATGYALPEPWILSYGLDSMIEPQTMEVSGSEVELPWLLPGCQYTFTLSDPSGGKVTGTTSTATTTGAVQYGEEAMPEDITFYAEQRDGKIVSTITSPTKPLPEGTVVMVTITGSDGYILSCGRTTCEGENTTTATVTIDTLPETAGTYGLSLYCNSQRLQSSTFTIN